MKWDSQAFTILKLRLLAAPAGVHLRMDQEEVQMLVKHIEALEEAARLVQAASGCGCCCANLDRAHDALLDAMEAR